MGSIRMIVLDVLKPHEPGLVELASAISDLDGVEGVDIGVVEVDKAVETVKITVEGPKIDLESVRKAIEDLGATIHSIDKIAAGRKIVEEARTPQD